MYDMFFESDEFPCHFSVDAQDFLSHSPGFSQPTRPYLMIGHGLPSSLKHQKDCQTSLETGLEGLALQSATTQKPFTYKDASSFNVALGYGGAQASWSTQFKTNPGVRAKESLLLRWSLEPKFRNPRLLLLWYGLEVSLCTRNARRCRLLDLLRSEPMIHYLSLVYRPDLEGTDYKTILLNALKSSNPYDFIELYDHHPEWQAELGTVVARCLNILKESGVNKKGDLGAFAFIEKFHDSEQLVILPKKDHSWIGLLQDSSDMATFALASYRCFGYRPTPGQKCRRKDRLLTGSKSVLETSYTVSKRSNLNDLIVTMSLGDRLAMANNGRFKIQRLSSRGILLGTWRVRLIPQVFSRSDENFQERREDGEPTIRVFVASRKEQRLPQLKDLPEIVPVGQQPEPPSQSFHVRVEEDLQSTSTKPALSASSSPQSLGNENPKIPERSFPATTATNGISPPISVTNCADDSSQTVRSHSRPDNPMANATPSESANKVSRINRGTQTDLVIIHADSKDTPSSTKDGQSPQSPSDSGASHSQSSRHSRSRSHDERNEDSSRHRHRHRHKESRKTSFNESATRDENPSSGYGLGAFLRSRAHQPTENQDQQTRQ